MGPTSLTWNWPKFTTETIECSYLYIFGGNSGPKSAFYIVLSSDYPMTWLWYSHIPWIYMNILSVIVVYYMQFQQSHSTPLWSLPNTAKISRSNTKVWFLGEGILPGRESTFIHLYTHIMLHVWNICLHLGHFWVKCRLIFHTWSIWDMK